MPSGVVDRYPHGARRRGRRRRAESEQRDERRRSRRTRRLVGRAQVGAVPRGLQARPSRCRRSRRCTYSPTASGAMTSSVHWSTSVGVRTRARSARLSDRNVTRANWRAMCGIGAAEALGELLAELGPVGVAHDHRRHRARPAEVVALERVEQLGDVGLGEPARRSPRRRCSGATARPARAWRTAPVRRSRRARRSSPTPSGRRRRRRAGRARGRSRARRRRSPAATSTAPGRTRPHRPTRSRRGRTARP